MERPGRGAVMIGVLLRSWVIACAGGVIVGFVFGVAAWLTDDSYSAGVAIFMAFLGGLAGVVLGGLLAVIVGAVACAALVPYPGAERSVFVVRLSAVLAVGVMMVWLGTSVADDQAVWFIGLIPAVGLAWWWAPSAIRWYVSAVEAAAAGAESLAAEA